MTRCITLTNAILYLQNRFPSEVSFRWRTPARVLLAALGLVSVVRMVVADSDPVGRDWTSELWIKLQERKIHKLGVPMSKWRLLQWRNTSTSLRYAWYWLTLVFRLEALLSILISGIRVNTNRFGTFDKNKESLWYMQSFTELLNHHIKQPLSFILSSFEGLTWCTNRLKRCCCGKCFRDNPGRL